MDGDALSFTPIPNKHQKRAKNTIGSLIFGEQPASVYYAASSIITQAKEDSGCVNKLVVWVPEKKLRHRSCNRKMLIDRVSLD